MLLPGPLTALCTLILTQSFYPHLLAIRHKSLIIASCSLIECNAPCRSSDCPSVHPDADPELLPPSAGHQAQVSGHCLLSSLLSYFPSACCQAQDLNSSPPVP